MLTCWLKPRVWYQFDDETWRHIDTCVIWTIWC